MKLGGSFLLARCSDLDGRHGAVLGASCLLPVKISAIWYGTEQV